jgi:hypothetical protein
MNSIFRFLSLATVLLMGAPFLTAQPASATFRPVLLESYALSSAYTTRGDLSDANVRGSVEVRHFDFSITGRTSLGEATVLLHGLAYARNSFDVSGAALLPEAGEEITLSLGLQQVLSARWFIAAYLRPGFYGDELSFDHRTFNAPLLATAFYTVNPDLSWIFGFSANAAADNPFIPVAGVRWKFAPDWTLNIGFPRAGLSYRAGENLSLHAGATVQGGGYRLTRALGSPGAGQPTLGRTWLEYREIRLGVGAEYNFTPKIALTADAGWTVDQRFDYFDRGYKLKGENIPYFALGIKGRF